MGKIERLKSGTYRTRVYIGNNSQGKPVYKSLTDTDKNRLRQTAADYKLNHGTSGAKFGNQTLGDAMESYISAKKPVLSPSTIKGYTAAQKVFKSEFEAFYGKKLYNIDDTAFQNVVNQMYATRSAKTVINYCGFVNTVMKANRCQELKITLPPRTPRRTDIPNADKMREITRAAEGTRLDIPIHLAIMGLRRSEICALKIDDLEGNVLCVHRAAVYNENGKVVNKDYLKTSGSFRYIQLPETLAKKIRDSGEITKMKPNNLTDSFKRFIRSNGFPDMRLHDCRHFMASYLHEQGVSDAEIMRMGGWKTDHVMKNVYRHALANDEKAKEIADSFSDF